MVKQVREVSTELSISEQAAGHRAAHVHHRDAPLHLSGSPLPSRVMSRKLFSCDDVV